MILQHVNWTLGKNWFSKSLKCWYILLYNIKNHLLPISSEEKSLSIGKMPSSQWDTCFPHFNFCFKNSDFYHWQQILSVVLLEVICTFTFFFFFFWRGYLSNMQVWISTVYLSIVLWSWEKKKGGAHFGSTHTNRRRSAWPLCKDNAQIHEAVFSKSVSTSNNCNLMLFLEKH